MEKSLFFKTVPDLLILKDFQIRGDHEIRQNGIFSAQIVGHMAAVSETEAVDRKVDAVGCELLPDLV